MNSLTSNLQGVLLWSQQPFIIPPSLYQGKPSHFASGVSQREDYILERKTMSYNIRRKTKPRATSLSKHTYHVNRLIRRNSTLTWQVVVSVTPQTILCIPSTQTFNSINFIRFFATHNARIKLRHYYRGYSTCLWLFSHRKCNKIQHKHTKNTKENNHQKWVMWNFRSEIYYK